MTKSVWLDLLGRNNDDPELLSALKKSDVKKIPKIKRDETEVSVQLDNTMLTFSDGELYPKLVEGGDGSSVLSGVFLPVQNIKWGQYSGTLPHELNKTDSRKKLRARFGKPFETDADFHWDEWRIGDHVLHVEFTEDYKEVQLVGLSLPYPEGEDDEDTEDED